MASSPRENPPVTIFDVEIDCRPGDAVLADISKLVASGERVTVMYVNAHTLNLAYRDADLCAVLKRATFLLNDGIGVDLAARLQGRRFPENLNGSDFNLRLLELAEREGWSAYLLGGVPGVAGQAAEKISARLPRLRVAGTAHGFSGDPEGDAAAIAATQADMLMVALGNPRQEKWLDAHLERTGARIGVAVGAFLDFQAARIQRAPLWMNRFGIEWVYRLSREPRRLWRRYVVGNPVFLSRALRDGLSRKHRVRKGQG